MAALSGQRQAAGCSRAAGRNLVMAPAPIPQRLCFQLAAPEQRAPARRAVAAPLAATSVASAPGMGISAKEGDRPRGYHWYETMMILKPNLSDEERDRELAKFEAYLNKEECISINALVKGRSKLAYPIRREQEGIYVLYTYCAKRQTARAIQLLLSKPESGSEDTVLRHITLCKL